jgi:hypothetical protein
MFVKEDSNNFYPIIIQPSLNYHELALKYYEAKDYPACGNYQRKASEKYIKDFLPLRMQLQENEDGTTSFVNLETLFNKLKEYLIQNELDFNPFKDFIMYKKLLLNSLSHDDLKSPYYKSELDEMFVILDELRKLKREEIIKTDELVFFETTDSSGQVLKFDVKSKDNLVLLKQGSRKKFQKCGFSSLNKYTNDVRIDFPSDDGNLKHVYKNICHHIGITPVSDVYSQFKDKHGNLLSSY